MKIGAILITLATLLGTPTMALAATVQIYTTVTNAHGGALFGQDLIKCVTSNGAQQECIKGPATFTVPAGNYSVTPVLPAGYAAALSDECSGTLEADGFAACHIDWTDGAPVVIQPAPVAPAPQPQPSPSGGGGASVPIPTGIPTPEPVATTTEATTTPAEPEVVTKIIVIHEYAATTPIESATTTAAIEDLQARVGWLEQVVAWLSDIITKLASLLGL